MEELTGLDFFIGLSDRTEDEVESSFDYSKWMFEENANALEKK